MTNSSISTSLLHPGALHRWLLRNRDSILCTLHVAEDDVTEHRQAGFEEGDEAFQEALAREINARDALTQLDDTVTELTI